MIDDLDEIKLAPDRIGSARKARSGHKRAMQALVDAKKKPLWLCQLKASKRKKREGV